jgi:kynureninase
MAGVDLSRAAAATLDDADPLAGFRARFTGTEDDGPGGLLYLDDNSLGRLPRETPAAVARVVEQEWGRGLVGSWADWVERSRRIGDVLAAGVLGAGPGEVLVGDSTSVNLYKLLAAADARPGRDVLVCCADDFPTDRYVVAGVGAQRGMTVREVPAHVDEGLDPGVLAAALDERVAVVVLSQGAYRSGALVDVAAVTRLARDAGALVVWDLSHKTAVPGRRPSSTSAGSCRRSCASRSGGGSGSATSSPWARRTTRPTASTGSPSAPHPCWRWPRSRSGPGWPPRRPSSGWRPRGRR